MKHQRVIDHRIHKQQGFTLLELLVALVLVLVLVVSVQRYIAGVSVDHEYLSQRHDDVTQVRIALSNIQRDVAQAGYFPYASDIDSNAPNAMPVGIFYSKNQLRVASYQPRDTAKDCNGAQKQYVQGAANQGLYLQGWTYVENVYSIVKGSLTCDGNGGDNGRRAVLDNIEEMVFTDKSGQPLAESGNNFIQVCLITSGESKALLGSSIPKMCDGKTSTPNIAGRAYYKTQVDMPVYGASFLAGQ